jgi:hypothetical protein
MRHPPLRWPEKTGGHRNTPAREDINLARRANDGIDADCCAGWEILCRLPDIRRRIRLQ